jgi:UDP-MurNAc hydroxylase
MIMALTIQVIGHAGFVVRSGDDLLVTDPWLSSDGAFDSAWFQFPCNHHLWEPTCNTIRCAANPAIYISHEHKDHFDRAFLRTVVHRQPTIFIADFSNKHLRSQLRALGFHNIVEVGDGEEVRHGSLRLHVFIDDNAINRDSAILVSDGRTVFLNLNDCKIFDRLALIRRELGSIDVFTCQFSGATWHPICYAYDESVYREISVRKRFGKFRAVLQAIRTIGPRRYLCSAGPACFLEESLMDKNFQSESIFPRQEEFLAFLERKLTNISLDAVAPGDVLDASSNAFVERGCERYDEGAFAQYIRRYQDRVEEVLAALPREKSDHECRAIFDALVEELHRKMQAFDAPRPIGPTIVCSLQEVPNRFIHLDLNTRHLSIRSKRQQDNFYHLAAPAWQIDRVLTGQMSWEDFSLTFRARLERRPDIYDTLVNGFFFSETEDIPRMIKVIQRIHGSSARTVVQTPLGRYQMDRYCPHQGADLSYGWFDNGDWVCPRHGWRFRLDAGGRSTASNDCIHARPWHQAMTEPFVSGDMEN